MLSWHGGLAIRPKTDILVVLEAKGLMVDSEVQTDNNRCCMDHDESHVNDLCPIWRALRKSHGCYSGLVPTIDSESRVRAPESKTAPGESCNSPRRRGG